METLEPDKILLTGASGLVGKRLCFQLIEDGFGVVGVARSRPDWWPRGAEFLEHDFLIDDTADFNEVLSNIKVVIHACDIGKQDIEKNCEIAYKLYELSRKNKCRKFIYISSIRVYASLFGKIDESTEPVPYHRDIYGKSKLRIENELKKRAVKDGSQVLILRLGNVFDEATIHKVPKQEALLTRLIYRGMNHHLISTSNVAFAISRILQADIRGDVVHINITQEYDGENDYFFLADQLINKGVSRCRRLFKIELFLQYLCSRLRRDTSSGHFCEIIETNLRKYQIFYPETLVDQITKVHRRNNGNP